MATDEPDAVKKTPTQVLAELVARRKAAIGGAGGSLSNSEARRSERAAAARSASKSKPAPRK